ncbi:unnamed protein product [Chrysoparadoxa australica]
MYGRTTATAGLETCQRFRDSAPLNQYIGPAGLYNTGTNLLYELLLRNCHGVGEENRPRPQWQVPWGKHKPVSWRGNYISLPRYKLQDQTAGLPVVLIKDPLTWLMSMCRNRYEVSFWADNGKLGELHCPHLANKGAEGALKVRVTYEKDLVTHHESLIHLWNKWYEDWLDVEFPRLLVRFEDLLFAQEQTVRQICSCAGGVMRDEYQGMEDTSKPHGGGGGRSAALERYGSVEKRVEGFTDQEMDFIRQHASQRVLDLFHYFIPES